MRIGICDDDHIWRRQAEQMIAEYGEQNHIPMELAAFQALHQLEAYDGAPPDVIFMDIVLEAPAAKSLPTAGDKLTGPGSAPAPYGDGSDVRRPGDGAGAPATPDPAAGSNGIDAAQLINRKWPDCQVVYLTNYLFYATEVYHTTHIFYVLKERFESRIDEIFTKILHEQQQRNKKLIFSALGGHRIVLAPEDILYFERRRRTTIITAACGVYEIRDKLSDLEALLPPLDFVRCHNSYLVYLPAVRELESGAFLMENGVRIPISRGCAEKAKNAFMKWALTQIS